MISTSTAASIAEIAASVRDRQVSPVALVNERLRVIDSLNPRLRAFITVTAGSARAVAKKIRRAASNGQAMGPLCGVPYACKDNFLTKGVLTTAGSKVLAGWVPNQDAAVVERLAAAGAILMGKTNLHEFAYGASAENPYYGTVPNPWNPTKLAGGSSSGSAAAVAAGMVLFALGTDTGGSVRVPAALCGVVGLKPSYGLVSTFGTIPFAWSLDHIGLFTRTVADAASVLEVLVGYDARDPASVPVRSLAYREALSGNITGLRIGVPKSFFFDHIDREIAAATRRTVRIAQRLGATCRLVDMPNMAVTRTVALVVQLSEALSYHASFLRDRRDAYGEDVRGGLASGQFILAEHYVRAKRMMSVYRQQLARIFDKVDVVVTPGCPVVAPAIGTVTLVTEGKREPLGNALTRFTSFFNLTGNPALTLPSGWHSTGLPMAVQIVARPFEEAVLFRVANALERSLKVPVREPRFA